jgi:hypothetical protein
MASFPTTDGQTGVSDQPINATPCENCGRSTRTVFGRCPQCGRAKGGRVLAGPARTTDSSLLDNVLTFVVVVVPAFALGGIAVVWLGFELLLAAIFSVALAALALALVSWW